MPASHIAAAHGREDLLELLLSYGASVDARSAYMRTPLGAAVEAGQMNTIRLLLDRGANVSARDYSNNNLLQIASSSGNPATFFALTNAGVVPSLDDLLSWYWAGHRQIWATGDHIERLVISPEVLILQGTVAESKAVLHLVPSHYLKLHLTCRVINVRATVLYLASTVENVDLVVL